MKPIVTFVAIAAFSLSVNAQQANSSNQVLVPDTGYIKVYGNTAPSQGNRYIKAPLPSQIFSPALSKKQDDKSKTIFIEKRSESLKSTAEKNPEERYMKFLEHAVNESGISDPRHNMKITSTLTDELGYTHIKSIRQFRGIDIYGSETTFHFNDSGERYIGKSIRISDSTEITPKVSSDEALRIAESDLKKAKQTFSLTSSSLKITGDRNTANLILFPHNNLYILTWEIDVHPDMINGWKYFVSALDGSILFKYYNTNTDGPLTATGTDLNDMIRTFNVYLTEGIYYMYDISQHMFNSSTNEGIIVTLDANNTSTSNLDYTYVTSVDNTWTQRAAVSAHCNATKTFQYFDTTYNWNSVNGKGCNIISLVNIVEDDGSSMENAFWNGQAVFYGNGGTGLKSLAGSLDVTAHELSHGVIASTANLAYYGQPGTINESFADIFACMVDRLDWTIGEDITRDGYSPSGAIRDLSNPHNMGNSTDPYWQPSHVSEMYTGDDDNGGIHINSGICNYAYYLFASRIGKSKAEKTYFRALREYLTKTSDFIDLRIAVVQAARDLFGEGSVEVYEAGQAFESVGIYQEVPPDKNAMFMINPGDEMLLSYDTNPNDPVSVYVSTSGGTHYRPLTNTPMRGKISITDDGKTGVFVSSERRLRMINTDSADINERIISGYSYYDNIAISKDGKRIAATKGWTDGSIYVIDLVSGEGRQYILYNPTTGSSIDAGGVLKAYSIEFDITGEYLIYDSYNVINSNSQKDIYYWDIGLIKVWDNNMDEFGTGTITKVFSALPANVNVANPTFSKNSPSIIAFDYFYDDGVIEEYGVYAANFETGQINFISANDRLGYPSFSTRDDKLAYSTINGLNTQVVKSIALKPDKITSAGAPQVLVPDAKWPVYFTTGIRPLGLAPVAYYTCDYKYGDFPLTVKFHDLSLYNPSVWQWTFEGGIPAESTEQNPEVTFENPGLYKVTLVTQNQFGPDTLIREKYIHVIDPVGFDYPETSSIKCMPNPFVNSLYISCQGDFDIKLFSVQGNLILADKNKTRLDLSYLPTGIYIIEIRNGKEFYREKLIKR